jgi:D-glycero-alpha-D-manno-heptose-7-phosphate kinase
MLFFTGFPRIASEVAQSKIANLHQAWLDKRSLSDQVSNDGIDAIYDRARTAGAIGGKLLGAGGFLAIFAEPKNHHSIRQSLDGLVEVPFSFENTGSQIGGFQFGA